MHPHFNNGFHYHIYFPWLTLILDFLYTQFLSMQGTKAWHPAFAKEMEKSTTGKCHNKFWFVVLCSPFGWLLCYAYFTLLKADNSLLIFSGHSFASTSKLHGSSHNYHLLNKGIYVKEENSDPYRRKFEVERHKQKHANGITKHRDTQASKSRIMGLKKTLVDWKKSSP